MEKKLIVPVRDGIPAYEFENMPEVNKNIRYVEILDLDTSHDKQFAKFEPTDDEIWQSLKSEREDDYWLKFGRWMQLMAYLLLSTGYTTETINEARDTFNRWRWSGKIPNYLYWYDARAQIREQSMKINKFINGGLLPALPR